MKTKIYILLGLCFIVCQRARSQVVSMETARQVAEKFFMSQTESENPVSIEMIPLLLQEIQKLSAEVDELKKQKK